MKIKKIAAFITLLFITVAPGIGNATAAKVSVILAGEPISSALSIYERFSGHKIVIAEEIKVMRTQINVTITSTSKEKALQILENTLRRTDVEIIHERDGSLVARKIAPKK